MLDLVGNTEDSFSRDAARILTDNAPVIYIHGPLGAEISGAFNHSIFKAPLKALHSGAKIVVKSLLKAPALLGADNNEEEQMT